MSDWRDQLKYYKAGPHRDCLICGSKKEIGIIPKFDCAVCEKHKDTPPGKLFELKGEREVKRARIAAFHKWVKGRYNKNSRDMIPQDLIGYQLEYITLKSVDAAYLVANVPWGRVSCDALNVSLTKIIKEIKLL